MYMYAILFFRHKLTTHKTCKMNLMTAHIRAQVFGDGKFLKHKNLVSPSGTVLDETLLTIPQVINSQVNCMDGRDRCD